MRLSERVGVPLNLSTLRAKFSLLRKTHEEMIGDIEDRTLTSRSDADKGQRMPGREKKIRASPLLFKAEAENTSARFHILKP